MLPKKCGNTCRFPLVCPIYYNVTWNKKYRIHIVLTFIVVFVFTIIISSGRFLPFLRVVPLAFRHIGHMYYSTYMKVLIDRSIKQQRAHAPMARGPWWRGRFPKTVVEFIDSLFGRKHYKFCSILGDSWSRHVSLIAQPRNAEEESVTEKLAAITQWAS